jgi:hypothetical protein
MKGVFVKPPMSQKGCVLRTTLPGICGDSLQPISWTVLADDRLRDEIQSSSKLTIYGLGYA